MWERKQVEIPESAKASLRMLLGQKQQAEVLINTYVRALRDTLNIEGEGWTIDMNEMVFLRSDQSTNGKVEKEDVVGAIASDNTRG